MSNQQFTEFALAIIVLFVGCGHPIVINRFLNHLDECEECRNQLVDTKARAMRKTT